MLNTRVAHRYAKSLLDLAIEQGQLEQAYADMVYLQSLTRQSRDFQNLLRSPVINAEAKIRAVEAVTNKNLSPLTLSFIRLMITKTRESALPEIITSFIKQYKEEKNIQIVRLTTATPVSEGVKQAIVARVKETGHIQNLELEEVIDPSIIGGFVLQVGDKLVDASVSYDLKQIAKHFDNNDFIYKVR